MSYTIEYNKQFIRSASGITPCWLAGDNNLTEFTFSGKERRVRSWSVFYNLLGVTEQDILDSIQGSLGNYAQHWKKNGKWVDDSGLIRWIRNGCKNAASIEDILAVNRMGSVRCYVSVWDKELKSSRTLTEYVSTTEEFDRWIQSTKDLVMRERGYRHCYPIVDFGTERLVHPHKATKEKPEQVVLQKGTGRNAYYLTAIESNNRHTWSRNIKDALVLGYEDAEKLKCDTFDSWMRQARVVNANAKDAPYNAVIRFVDGNRAGCYVVKRTNGYIYTSLGAENAHHYRDQKTAEKALKKLQDAFQYIGNMAVVLLES